MKTLLIIALVAISINCAIVRDKVWKEASLNSQRKTHILIHMTKQMDFTQLKNEKGLRVQDMEENQRGYFVMNALQRQAKVSQKRTIEYLEKNNIAYQAFWVSNSIAVADITEEQIRVLATIPDIDAINSDVPFSDLDQLEKPEPFNKKIRQLEPNVKWIGADKVWAMGHQGAGIVTGVIDTGIQHTHDALKNSYRGKEGNKYNHNFNWWDADQKVRTPVDTNGHGTHCTGTVCGGKGTSRQIGVAPEAKWIHCRAISGSSQASKYLSCYQFFMAPHDLDGKNADPSLRPHTTSHSYGCGGCRADDLKAAFESLKASGIFLSVSSGNSGSRCSTISRPPGFYTSAFTVGALNKGSNVLARFSSRGPITYDRSNRLKPEITAPGVSVVSSYRGNTYRALSGTSMASPAVNGVVALLWDAVPELKRKIDETINVIQLSATKVRSTECGVSGSPNNLYGYGSINVAEAVNVAKEIYQANKFSK